MEDIELSTDQVILEEASTYVQKGDPPFNMDPGLNLQYKNG